MAVIAEQEVGIRLVGLVDGEIILMIIQITITLEEEGEEVEDTLLQIVSILLFGVILIL